jgi:hypothetical protein
VQGTSTAFGAAASEQVDLTVNTGDATIVYAVAGDGREEVTIHAHRRVDRPRVRGDRDHPNIRGANGRVLSAREGEALGKLFGLADGVFKLLAQLTAPVAAIVALGVMTWTDG